ncbi:hypothetical protein CONLIGDRAFT_690831 [Coniochaeta ligniaria NRRL 30616]|uniref:Uncharacterized protein n=1 Tax=Coniochaeta ligniaria NRRL 30616 TaxID=1408157 RepID=A0A1J7ICE5_9PEZI|nr:hypothetical protein CONLIGDRAFT_690831 [Coniochaeta ligniaria NRRL 30616]
MCQSGQAGIPSERYQKSRKRLEPNCAGQSSYSLYARTTFEASTRTQLGVTPSAVIDPYVYQFKVDIIYRLLLNSFKPKIDTLLLDQAVLALRHALDDVRTGRPVKTAWRGVIYAYCRRRELSPSNFISKTK